MNKRISSALAAGALAATVLLAGCSSPEGEDNAQASPSAAQGQEAHGDHGQGHQDGHGEQGGHGGMEHPMDGGPVPEGMTEASDAEYPVGTEVTLTTDHMDGMDGAPATVVGAYDTNTYSIDYTPADGGEPVKDHKWVVQEEIDDAGDQRLPDGTEVTVNAEHMGGMKGSRASIAGSTDETVYVVDYEADGMTMTNHKWVVESELAPAS